MVIMIGVLNSVTLPLSTLNHAIHVAFSLH
jgi:hypothetical protein